MSRSSRRGSTTNVSFRGRLTRLCGVGAVVSLAATLVTPTAAVAADPWDPYGEGLQNTNKDLGYPTFVNAQSAIPSNGVAFDPSQSYLAQVLAADVARGAGRTPGNDFWIDRMLARDGVQPDEPGGLDFLHNSPQNIDYDNNVVMFSKGRSLYMEDSTPGLGFRGDVAYIDSLGDRSAYTVDVRVGGAVVTLTENTSKRHNTPSYWYSEFTGGGLLVKQAKFITENNVASEWLQIATTDGSTKPVELVAASPLATTVEGQELTGLLVAPHNVTTVKPRLSGDGFTASGATLTRSVTASGTTTNVKLQMGFLTSEIPQTADQYSVIRAQSAADAFAAQTRAYNQWWADNIPFVQTPEGVIDKSVFYRWWLLRTNFLDAAIPGNDYQFPTSMEGIFGRAYNNAIVLTTGMFIDDMKYFRDPTASYGTWLSAGEVARSGRYIDNPGNPNNWSSSYANYVSDAAWRAYELHGGDPSVARKLAANAEGDVKGQLAAFDGNKNNVIEYSNSAMTGNDQDAVSFSYRYTGGWGSYAMDRPETAYLYAGAQAAENGYRLAGDTAAADRMKAQAAAIRSGVISTLWENKRSTPDEMGLYGNLLKAAYADGSSGLPKGFQVPWKEINTYYPYSVGLMPKPGDSDYDPKYLDAFRLFVDQRQYSPFPFYTANQVDSKARAARDVGRELFNNFSTINSTVIFRLLSSTLRDYPNSYLTSDYYKKLLYWNAWAIYEKGDVTRQNENEFWAHGSAADGGSIKYRSWIHQTQLGTTNFTVIEDVAGLRPRTDRILELSPIDIGWDHFTVNNVKYHDQDLTIVWDKPGDGVDHYPSTPEGYSAYLGGKLAFTIDSLKPVTFDTATGTVTTTAAVTTSTAQPVQDATAVRFAPTDRVVDLLAKAGVDVDTSTSGAANLAAGRPATASYSAGGTTGAGNAYAPAGSVDGTTANEPFWGTAGSPNGTDWLQIDLGGQRTVDEARIYFYKSSSGGTVNGYAAPAQYVLQYWDGTAWVGVTGQARTPTLPTGNYNLARFAQVTTDKVRLLVTHQAGARTGVKEIQLRDTNATFTPAQNQAPVVSITRDTAYAQPGRARFTGSIVDDGLPTGTISAQWTVKSAPTPDARVSFSNPTSANTVASFSVKGAYVLTFTASDGERSTASDVAVTIGDDAAAGTDLSTTATPTASYTAAWNRVGALNDSRVDPSGDQASLWGSYRDGTRPASDTLTYTWPSPTRVNSANAYFWNDSVQGSGAGVALPSGWKLDYLDEFGQWQPVTAKSAYPVTAMTAGVPQASRIAFDPVVTTQIRATITASPNAAGTANSAVALSELDVLGENPAGIETVAVSTPVGTPATLPTEVTAVYSDGTRGQVKAEWNPVDASRYDSLGRFTATGVLAGGDFPIEATVSVSQAGTDVGAVQAQTASTTVNRAPDLPRAAVVNLTGGNGALQSRPVTWAAVDPAAYSKPGTFDVTGTVSGTTVPATVTVTVTNDPDGDVPGAVVDLAVTQQGSSATLTWKPGAAGSAVTGHDVVMTRLDGTVASRTAAPASATSQKVDNLASGEYVAIVRALSDAGRSDPRRIAFSVAATPAAPNLTVTPAQPSGSNGWYSTTPTVTGRAGSQELAATAVASASITAGHNRLSGLNDGTVLYSGRLGNLGDADSQTKMWGTFTNTDRAASHTVQYAWAAPKVIDSTTVHFWTDRNGTGNRDGAALPTGWKAQYLGADGTWKDVAASGPYPLTAGRPNSISFTPVTTTALRLVLAADTNGTTNAAVVVSEWSVSGADAATTVEARINDGAWQPIGTGLAVDAQGDVTVTARSRTGNGLTSTETPTKAKVDTVRPTATLVGGPEGSYRVGGPIPAAPTCTASDATSGVAKCEVAGYSTDIGTHTLTATATDNAGLTATVTRQYTITEAGTAPTLTVTASPAQPTGRDGWWTSPVTVTATAKDDGAAAPAIQISRDNGKTWEPYTSVQFTDGDRTLWIRAVDSDGNISDLYQQRFAVDSALPQAAAVVDQGARKVTIEATDPEPGSGVATIEYRVNGGTWTAVSGASAAAQVGAENSTVEFRATDRAGNVSLTGTAAVPATPTAPKATVKVTSAGPATTEGWYRSDVIVAITAPAGHTAQYRIDGGSWKAATRSFTISTNGAHVVEYRLLKNNVVVERTADSLPILLDKTAPATTATRTPTSTGTPRNPVTLAFGATDPVSGVARLEYRINQDTWVQIAPGAPLVLDKVGDYVVTYRATDVAGNISPERTTTASIKTSPTTSLRASSTTVTAGSPLTFSLAGFDRYDTVTLTHGAATLGSVFTDVNGSARITLPIPTDTPSGAVTISAAGSDGDPVATVRVTVRR